MAESMKDELVWIDTDRYCPVCGSRDIDYGEMDYDTDSVYMKATCNHCDSKFTFGYWVKDAYIDEDGRRQ